MLKKLLALTAFLALITPIGALADPTSSSVSPQAQRVGSTTDETIHLDLSA